MLALTMRFLVFCLCLIEHRVYSAGTASVFKLESSNREILTHDALVWARSDISCVAECAPYWNCQTVAFEPSSGRCYLNVTYDEHTASAGPTEIYRDEAPMCRESDAPSVPNAVIGSVQTRDLTTFALNVTCAQDFLRLNADIFPIRCSAGVWEADDVCRQRVWRDGTVTVPLDFNTVYSYPAPDAVYVGWKACLTGTPIPGAGDHERFSVNLMDDNLNFVVHFNPRIVYGETVLTQRIDNAWQPETKVHDFPFVTGQAFSLTIQITGANEVVVHVDGSLYATWTPVYPVLGTTKVHLSDYVTISYMDLWCA